MHAVVLYSACHNIMFTVSQQSTNTQDWYWLAVSLEEMLVSQRKLHSHVLLKELLFSGEMKHLERRPCTTQVHHSPWGMSLGQKLSATTKVAWFPLWAFVQLPHAMEPQLHAQIGTETPVNHFHCKLYQVSCRLHCLCACCMIRVRTTWT